MLNGLNNLMKVSIIYAIINYSFFYCKWGVMISFPIFFKKKFVKYLDLWKKNPNFIIIHSKRMDY